MVDVLARVVIGGGSRSHRKTFNSVAAVALALHTVISSQRRRGFTWFTCTYAEIPNGRISSLLSDIMRFFTFIS